MFHKFFHDGKNFSSGLTSPISLHAQVQFHAKYPLFYHSDREFTFSCAILNVIDLFALFFFFFFHFCLSKNTDQPSGKQQITFCINNHIMLFTPNNNRSSFWFKFHWIDQNTFRPVLTQLLYALFQNCLVFSCIGAKNVCVKHEGE